MDQVESRTTTDILVCLKSILKEQDGIAVLVLVILIAMSTNAYFLSEFSPGRIEQQQQISTGKSLSRAKDALIAYAVSRGDVPTPTPKPGRLARISHQAASHTDKLLVLLIKLG
jgi:hypothetical protein